MSTVPAQPASQPAAQPPAPPPASAPPAGGAPGAPPAPPPVLAPRRRRGALIGLALLVLLGAAGFGAYWWLVLRHYESTDNAYVQAPLVQITPRIDGTVVAVEVDDTDKVQAGQVLVRLDASDAQLALQRAAAALAQAVREVRVLQAQDGSFDAQIRARRADVERLRAELARAEDDAARRLRLQASGAISDEDIRHAEAARAAARSALAAAQSAQAAAEQQALANLALSDGTRIDSHPGVQQAAAALRQALLTLRRTELRAPLAGEIARRTVQVGQRVAAGAPLMAVIPLDQVWVDANFKEAQLRRMHTGQPVRMTADAYGSKVEYRGRIVGIGAGTGAAFALLPAQNATGNWIKVVQRVPVRIALDAPAPAEHPLRVGLSMQVTVDLDEQAPAAPPAGSATRVVDADDQAAQREADDMVRRIIAANLKPIAPR
ncbi:MAG: HlyD family efflux transporter periplasmic adaptor subunit [Proteobacteria bacterium]|nr:HlyD family efflux transporter periplasmic adaptor subunit [Pseudomonadota bacterium]